MGKSPRRGQVGQHRKSGLAGLLDEYRDRSLAGLLRGGGLVAGLAHQRSQAFDVPFGDAVGRVEGESDLIVLPRDSQLPELPHGLGQAVLSLSVWGHLQDLTICVGSLGPMSVGGLGNRLVHQLALDPNGVPAGALFDLRECQGWILSSTAPGHRAASEPPRRVSRKACKF